MVVVALLALPATAQSWELGLVGWRWLPSFGWSYRDNFYGSDWVYWCYSEHYGGIGSRQAPPSSRRWHCESFEVDF
jgi:hypothetical protein